MEYERNADIGVAFFHRVVNQYLRARNYRATGRETDRKLTESGRRRVGRTVRTGFGACQTRIREMRRDGPRRASRRQKWHRAGRSRDAFPEAETEGGVVRGC